MPAENNGSIQYERIHFTRCIVVINGILTTEKDRGVLEVWALTKTHVTHILYYMKTTTVRDLKHGFARVESWVHRGEVVEVTKRGMPIFKIVPMDKASHRIPKVDFHGMLKEIWGKRVFSEDEIQQIRDFSRGERS